MQKYFFLCLFLLTLVSRESLGTPSEKKISDSLVRDLSCQGLSLGSLLGKIRPEAFSSRYHLPLRNWAFRSGAFPLAACWGMSSTQRKFFYLLRHGEKTAAVPPLPLVLDMIRGARPELADLDLRDDGPRKHIVESPLSRYPVVSLPEDSLDQGFFQDPSGQGLLSRLLAGVTESLGEFTVHRDFRSEVERSQERHFYRFRNVGLGAGSGPQSPKKNFKTLRQLQTNLKLHRLTLVDLRLTSTFQHVVIAKSFVQDAHGNVRFRVYDSNQPEQDQILYFHKASGHFYGPQILLSNKALGVFIVDEKEREDLEASLLSYYRNLCQN